jgi:hypothetical protein
MQTRTLACAALGVAAAASSASAAIISFSQQNVWDAYTAYQALSVVTEDFNSLTGGFYSSGFSSSVGGVTWTATATGGLRVQSGLFSTVDPTSLSFSFAPGVQGVSGNFFGTDGNFTAVPSLVQVTLADGSSSLLFTNSASAFAGFFSTGAAIASLTITAAGSGNVYPTVDNLFFAVPVPAPGAAALIGLAALVCRRRRDVA